MSDAQTRLVEAVKLMLRNANEARPLTSNADVDNYLISIEDFQRLAALVVECEESAELRRVRAL